MIPRFLRRASASTVASVAALLLLGILFVKNVAAGPTNEVRPGDLKKATRTALADVRSDSRESTAAAGSVAGNGVVEPADRETKIGANVPGRISRVLVKEGDVVAEGALLLELDDRTEAAALAAAEGDLAVAKTTLTRTARGLRREDVDALIGDAAAARARAISSAEVALRTERLAKSGAVTEDERTRAQRQAQADEGAAKAAEARRLAGTNGARREDVLVAQAQVAAAVARRDTASATLDRLHIRSPINATVLQLKIRAGEYYNTLGTDSLLVLGDTRVTRVRMDVDERDVAKVRLGAPAYVTLSAYPGRHFQGKVVEVGRRMGRKNVRTDDPVERLDAKILEAVVEISEPDATALVPGIRVTAYVNAS